MLCPESSLLLATKFIGQCFIYTPRLWGEMKGSEGEGAGGGIISAGMIGGILRFWGGEWHKAFSVSNVIGFCIIVTLTDLSNSDGLRVLTIFVRD
jgi:hypothetical protein